MDLLYPEKYMVRILMAFLLFSCIDLSAQSQVRKRLHSIAGKAFFTETEENAYQIRHLFVGDDSTRKENPRVIAIILDVTLGVLGVHRLYLGTDLKVPIFYTLTLGGGTLLWLVDLALLIGSKDIEKFMDNPRLFMWVND